MTASVDRESVLLHFTCMLCGRSWYWRTQNTNADVVTVEQELEHALKNRCNGSVVAKVLGYYSNHTEVGEVELQRLEAELRKCDRFCEERRDLIRSQAILFDVSVDAMAAVLFAQEELRAERELDGKPREVLIGFGSTRVAGISSVNITVQSNEFVRPLRLEVPPDIAADFLLTDLKIGKDSQFVSSGCIPMASFSSDQFRYLKLSMDVMQIAQFCTISVTNINACARNFQGVLVCQKIPDRLEGGCGAYG